MSMRIFSAIGVAFLLVSCGPESAPPPGDEIDCALGVGAEFAAECTVERTSEDGVEMLVLHHPDGGFRRLVILPDGRGVEPADGADTVAQSLTGALLEVAVDGDRYRLPTKPMEPVTGD